MVRQDVNDLLTFLAAQLGYGETPLSAAQAAMTKVRRPGDSPQNEQALGWVVTTGKKHEIVWKSGTTGGFNAFMGFDPKTRVGVVVLSNMLIATGVDDIGMHLLDPSRPLAKLAPFVHRREIPLAAEIFDRYVGSYRVNSKVTFVFMREGARMFTQMNNAGPKFELLAESEKDFFLKTDDAQITFEVDGKGRGVVAIIHQGGHVSKGKRVD